MARHGQVGGHHGQSYKLDKPLGKECVLGANSLVKQEAKKRHKKKQREYNKQVIKQEK